MQKLALGENVDKKFTILKVFWVCTLALLLTGCSGDIVTTRAYFNPNWTPDGMIIAGKWTRTVETNTLLGGVSDQTIVRENKYEVVKFDVSGNNETVLFDAGNLGGDVYITMSPNGSYVTVGGDLYTASGTFVASISSSSFNSLDWSADSSKIVFDTSASTNIFNVATATANSIISDCYFVSWQVSDNIVCNDFDISVSLTTLKLIDVNGNILSAVTIGSPQVVGYPQYVPSSSNIIAIGSANDGYVYSLPDFSLVSTFDFNETSAWRWHVSPDGTKITFGKTGTQPLRFSGVWAMDINGGNLARVK